MIRRFVPILFLGFVGLLPQWTHASQASSLRLISTTPEITELLFQLGKGSDVIATPQFSFYPKEASRIPVIGPLFSPSVERTFVLKPDAILLDAATPNDVYNKVITDFGLRHFSFHIRKVEDLFSQSQDFLSTFYGEKNSSVLAEREARWRKQDFPSKPFTYLGLVWSRPVILFAGATFLSDLLRHLGGTNLAPVQWRIPYPEVSEEWIIAHPPEIVFYLDQGSGNLEEVNARLRHWWPKHPPELLVLSWDTFARASFTPLENLADLSERVRRTLAQ